MFRRKFQRSRRIRYFKTFIILFASCTLIDLLYLTWRLSSRSCLQDSQKPKQSGAGQKIFIASTHWNNEIALRGFWNKAVLDLAQHVGPENVHVSIYESGSWDDSKGALRTLDQDLEALGVQRTIILDEKSHADEIAGPPASSGWVDTPRGKKELRRIPFLSKARNKSVEPMLTMALNGTKFDYVLFLNDVVFTTQDVMTLLGTRDGDYAAACSLDFKDPPKYYDTFALRDSDGYEAGMLTFPYFKSPASRNAMISGQPVPVKSCWNGIVSFSALPFYSTQPLLFRGIPDSLATHHLEASECCLIHIDNPLTAARGVWLNPAVRVAYSLDAYKAVHPPSNRCWPSVAEGVRGVWENRLGRWTTFTAYKDWIVRRRVREWEKRGAEGEYEPGVQCLINEMQVLIPNGWAHV